MGCLKINSEKNNLAELAQNLKNESNIDVIISATNAKNVITLKFQSGDQMINCYILCNEDDIFNSIVNKVFEKKPEFKEYGNFFLCGGNVVNEYKSIKENKIKDGNTILVVKREENNEVEEEKSSNNPQTGNYIKTNNSEKDHKKFKKEVVGENANIIILRFLSMDQNIDYCISCKKDDIFSRVVERLLEKYPEYRKKKLAFVARAQAIKEYLSVEENNLEDNEIVSIFEIDD